MIPAHHVQAPQHWTEDTNDDDAEIQLAQLGQKVDKGKGRARDLEPSSTKANANANVHDDVRVHAPVQTIVDDQGDELYYRPFRSEEDDLPGIMRLVEQELSEPPHLAFLVFSSPSSQSPIATIICKQDAHRRTNRGYIAMLSVDRAWRRRGIASKLVELVIDEMGRRGAHEVVLETEYDNAPSLALYDRLGFLREKRLHRFYSNGKDAFRLILPLDTDGVNESAEEADRGRWAVGSGPDSGSDAVYEEGRDTPRPDTRGLPEAYDSMYI